MSVDSTILAGRRMMEGLMESTCVIRRGTAEAIDHATGLASDTTATIYTGPCRVKFAFARVTEVQAAGQTVADQRPILSLPVGSPGSGDVRTNDVAEILTNPMDPDLVGVKFRVAGVHSQSQATARRFPVEISS